MLTDLSFCWVD